MYLKSLAGIGQCRDAQGEFEEAVDWYRRVLEVDELREDVHQCIMRCYAEAGRRSDALAQYRQCREILRRELDLEPSTETVGLYERIAAERRKGS
jgi:DNA-binding SARP family transcriptional activator